MGLFDGWGNMGGMEDAVAQPPGLLDNIGMWLKDPRNAAGLQAFGAALAKAGAPTREPKGSFAGGLSEALSGFTQGQQGYDQTQLQKMMQQLQMQKAQQELNQKVDPLSYLSKIDVEKFTPASMAEFLATKNPSKLVARTKVEVAPSGQTYDPMATPVGQNLGKPLQIDTGNAVGFLNPQTLAPMTSFAKAQTPDSAASNATTMRGQNMTDSRARELNAITQFGAHTQVIETPNGPMVINKSTATGAPVTSGGAIVPGLDTQKKQVGAKNVLNLLDDAEKQLKGSTNSYAGAGADLAARAIGIATPGAIKIGGLKAIEGALLAQMPRMEGPQSNYDVQNYKEAAGMLGDSTVPIPIKKQAIKTIREIQGRYAGATTNADSGKYEEGKVYVDASGNKALYQNGQWVPQ